MVTRVFVEKKPGFDIEAGHMLSDLRGVLGVKGLTGVRILNRYDVDGLTPEEFELASKTILSEPNLDNVYPEDYAPDCRAFAMEYLPGQYDQRADSAAQCVQLLTQGERPEVANARMYAVKGDLSQDDLRKMQEYLVNPVESRLASLKKPQTLDMDVEVPENVKRVEGFIEMSPEEIAGYWKQMGFAMSVEDLEFCRDYFATKERRDPTVTELRVIDTYWSDHCRHTTFLTRLEKIEIEKAQITAAVEEALQAYYDARKEVYGDRDKTVCLMDMACIGAKLLKKRGMIPDLDESEEINACSIEVPIEIDGEKETWLVQFKNETHNHPTEIEPFGGASGRRHPRPAFRARLCLSGHAGDRFGRSHRAHKRNAARQASPAQDYHQRRPRLFLLWKPNRPCHRPGGGALRQRLYRQAPGNRRGGRRFSQVECGAGGSRAR